MTRSVNTKIKFGFKHFKIIASISRAPTSFRTGMDSFCQLVNRAWPENNCFVFSSRLIYSGELTRSIAGRREQRLAFLFDSEIILVKNNTHSGPKQPYFFKERIDLRSVFCTMPGPCKFLTQIWFQDIQCITQQNFSAIELQLLSKEELSLLKIDFHYRKETQRLKWYDLIQKEIANHKNSGPPDQIIHEFESNRPKSAIMVSQITIERSFQHYFSVNIALIVTGKPQYQQNVPQ